MAQSDTHTIRTYMSFTYPVDPASVKTLVDMDLCYSLSTTLVDWSDERRLTEGLAEPIESPNKKQLILKLKSIAKWSDGSPITAVQVIRSIEHAKQLHDEAMKGLFEVVNGITAKDDKTIVFNLNRPQEQSQILHKLTEPVYGVLFITADGKQDLSRASGPYSLESSSAKELVLKVNPNWYAYQSQMPKVVVIRQPKVETTGDQEGFADDSWPNLMSSSSLMTDKSLQSFKEMKYSIWNRNLDRLFFLSLSKKNAGPDGRKLLQALSQRLDRAKLLKDLGGYSLSDQFFPPGYVIFDPEFQENKNSVAVPTNFASRPLELLAAEGRVGTRFQNNLKVAIKEMTGIEPNITMVPLNKYETARVAGNFDLAVVTVAVNDPNAEGPVSFLFGLMPPPIPDSNEPGGNFKDRITKARSQDEKLRNAEYRKVFTQATQDGCVLPLFHYSSIVIARDGIDLSNVPSADETVAFSKIRFK